MRCAVLLAFPAILAAQPASDAGRRDFVTRCAACHGGDANGGERAPAIRRSLPDAQLLDIIRHGKPAAGMPAFDLPAPDLARLVAFLRATPALPEPATHLQNARAIPFSELVDPRSGDWPSYNGRLGGNRHSALAQIARYQAQMVIQPLTERCHSAQRS